MLVRQSCISEQWRFDAKNSVISVACTNNCSYIAVATVGRRLLLLDIDGREVWQANDLDNEAWSVAITENLSAIAVGTASKNPASGTVYIYDLSGQQLFSITLDAPIWSLTFSSSGSTLFASCWNGTIYRFERTRQGYKQKETFNSLCEKGLYGISCAKDGSKVLVCAYNDSVIELDGRLKQIAKHYTKKGLYNIAFSPGSDYAIAGSRDGEVLLLEGSKLETRKLSGVGRPICGVAVPAGGQGFVCGSFDGKAYLLGVSDIPLAAYETYGEVWSVACSDDFAHICVASGDHTVSLISNACNVAAIREVCAVESSIFERNIDDETVLDRLLRIYREYGLFEYGFKRLEQMRKDTSNPGRFQKYIELFLNSVITASPSSAWAHFEIGRIDQRYTRHQQAIEHFQKASCNPIYSSKALALCADSFRAKQLPAATATCYRRAREQQEIGADAKHVLFNLGRSYEDTKQFPQAVSHYQLLASWDINYRDTWQRLVHLQTIMGSGSEVPQPRVDYTGITISLLGPDAPRDVGAMLYPILQARTAEVLIDQGERESIANIIQILRTNTAYCRGITGIDLDYSQQLFLKYDYSLPEDETKKFLETVNLMFLLREKSLKRTLDIGSATGRYPTLMTWLGAQADGIDIEQNAIEYAQKLVPQNDEWPRYQRADATKPLPFASEEFDLITCMMGTFSHLPKPTHEAVIESIYKSLKPDGRVAISTWDMECEHLAFMSIYNETQKDMIRRNTPSTKEIENLLLSKGFSRVVVRPFCMLPQVVVYDLGTENLRAGDIQLIAQADLAVRSLYPIKHGEMYLAFGVK